MSRLTLDIREVVSQHRGRGLRLTVSIINRSLEKLEMPPSVSVFEFRTSPSGSWRTSPSGTFHQFATLTVTIPLDIRDVDLRSTLEARYRVFINYLNKSSI